MINSAVYIAVYLFEIVLLIGIIVYLGALIYSSARGAPYVPTKKKLVMEILKKMKLRKGQKFLELGCGDGRIVRMAALHYGVKGYGVDINPIIIWWARFKSLKHKSLDLTFKVGNVHTTPLAGYDVIYLFLLPEFLEKLAPKIEKEAKKGVLVVSHGFVIEKWKKYLTYTLKMKPFDTYYYRITGKK